MLARQVLAYTVRRELARQDLQGRRANGCDWRRVGEIADRCTGATLAQVREQLGHADIKTTSIYLHAKDRAEMIREMPIK